MFDALLHPAVLVFLIPIVAIICGTVIKLQKLKFKHEERLAKIEAGIDPDAEYEYYDDRENLILKEKAYVR